MANWGFQSSDVLSTDYPTFRFEEDTYEFDKDKYLMAQSNVINRIMEYQEQIMNMEIKYGLEKDYE